MRMTEIQIESQRPVDGYGPGGFRIDGDWREGSLILLPSGDQAARRAADASRTSPRCWQRPQSSTC